MGSARERPEEERLAEILGEAYARGAVDPEQVIREHPELADALRAHFEAQGLLDRALRDPPTPH